MTVIGNRFDRGGPPSSWLLQPGHLFVYTRRSITPLNSPAGGDTNDGTRVCRAPRSSNIQKWKRSEKWR